MSIATPWADQWRFWPENDGKEMEGGLVVTMAHCSAEGMLGGWTGDGDDDVGPMETMDRVMSTGCPNSAAYW